jgi:hypothetical protein
VQPALGAQSREIRQIASIERIAERIRPRAVSDEDDYR